MRANVAVAWERRFYVNSKLVLLILITIRLYLQSTMSPFRLKDYAERRVKTSLLESTFAAFGGTLWHLRWFMAAALASSDFHAHTCHVFVVSAMLARCTVVQESKNTKHNNAKVSVDFLEWFLPIILDWPLQYYIYPILPKIGSSNMIQLYYPTVATVWDNIHIIPWC